MINLSFLLLNIFVNSFLSFFTVSILIEGIIFLFRIKQGRAASTLRMMPFIKLPMDIFLYDYSSWAYSHGINPLLCEPGSRTLSVKLGWVDPLNNWNILPFASGIQMTTSENMTFTVADLIGQSVNSSTLNGLTILFILITFRFLSKTIINCKRFFRQLHACQQVSLPGKRKIRNFRLRQLFQKVKLRVVTCNFCIGSPFVAGFISPIIYFPSALEKALSRREYEAVLAHEYEHIRYKDNLVRLFLHSIRSIFWWVPTYWLLKRIEEGQEISCDLKCEHYAVNPLDLASAICKSARASLYNPGFCHHLADHTTPKRIKLLMQKKATGFKYLQFSLFGLAALITFLVLLFGRFWTF